MRSKNLFLLPLLLVWFLGACSIPAATTDSGVTPPVEICTGDGCLDVASDAAGTGDVEVISGDVGDTVAAPDDTEQVEVECDECVEGTILCTDQTHWVGCVEKKGCWKWEKAPILCGAQHECACMLDAVDDDFCEHSIGEECVCLPECEGRECGGDGCGGDCWFFDGANEGVEICFKDDVQEFCDLINGVCEVVCKTVCEEGDTMCNNEDVQHCFDQFADDENEDPCWTFGVAEPCPENQSCSSSTDACACVHEPCGDGCCATAEEVCFGEQCLTPDCDEKECGDDGAGGTCGECDENEGCQAGICVSLEECDNKCEEGDVICADGVENGYQECVEDGEIGGETCWKLSVMKPCEIGHKCVEETPNEAICVCVPDCEGKQCGSDGCEGTCGDCKVDFGLNFKCMEDFSCDCVCDGVPPGTVCDFTDGVMKEYANPCEAECAGVPSSQDDCVTGYCKGTCPGCEDECTEADLALNDYCGKDMVTYPSFCAIKCGLGSDECISVAECPELLHPGACKPDCCEDQGCPSDYEPLCGSDGVTYCNACTLGKCPANPAEPPLSSCFGECGDALGCSCSNDCEPVCGMLAGQKRNFLNPCMLECLGADKLWDGECCLNADQSEDYVCADIGGTLQVFLNEDFLNCQSPGSPKLYDIPKTKAGIWWKELCSDCQCDMTAEAPVCGTDWAQYGNNCALECAAGIWPETVEVTPVCDVPCVAPDCDNACDVCPCPPQTEGLPIDQDTLKVGLCGASGNTYGNACSAAKYGEKIVSQIWCATCQEQCGDDPVSPVCCEDGVTYPMACIAEKCNEYLNPVNCNKGKCCQVLEDCDDGIPDNTDNCNMLQGKPWGVCENY
jgi:hypothetical protein